MEVKGKEHTVKCVYPPGVVATPSIPGTDSHISEFKASLPYTALGQQETLHRSMEMQLLSPVLKLSSGPQANPILDNP